MKPASRAFLEEADRVGMSWYQRLHGYVYGRWPYHFIGAAMGERKVVAFFMMPFFWLVNKHSPFRAPKGYEGPNFADSYHGKPMPLESATKLVTLNRPVHIKDLEQVLPYKQAREIILENPESLALLDCPCRASRKNPCLPLDVCIIVGEPMVSFTLEHHPKRCRKITVDEAVQVLKETDARGNAHHAFFKEAVFGRFYAICNCCKCCCGAIQAHRMGQPMLCSSGYLAMVDKDECVGCGECAKFCPFDAIRIKDKKARVFSRRCLGCGVCESKCPKDAISLVLEPKKGVPLEVDNLVDTVH